MGNRWPSIDLALLIWLQYRHSSYETGRSDPVWPLLEPRRPPCVITKFMSRWNGICGINGARSDPNSCDFNILKLSLPLRCSHGPPVSRIALAFVTLTLKSRYSCQTALTWVYVVVNHHIRSIHHMYNSSSSMHYSYSHATKRNIWMHTNAVVQIRGDLLGCYVLLKRLSALGVWNRKCKRPHQVARHCVVSFSLWE